MIVYSGNGIDVVAVGLNRPSSNQKTGPMIQMWIMGENNGCSGCPSEQICYVSRGKGRVQKSLDSGNYTKANIKFEPHTRVRLGAWGDPAKVSRSVWEAMGVKRFTGYTHQWRDLSASVQEYKGYLMASVESIESLELAESLGWKCYYNMVDVSLGLISEEEVLNRLGSRAIPCLYNSKGISCYDCLLCSSRARKHIYTMPHGSRSSEARMFASNKLETEQNKTLVRELLVGGM